MTHEDVMAEFVQRMRGAGAENLLSVVLFGSAAQGEFDPEYSDVNLLCVVRDGSFSSLRSISPVIAWWRKKRHRLPLVVSLEEMKSSAAEFSIEFIDMKQRYRVLYGEDVLRVLEVPMHLHRFQVEYELREKLFLLRQQLLLANNNETELWDVMLHSLSSFTTLFRHVLVELGEQERKHSRDAVVELSKRLHFDDRAFLELMDIRAKKVDRKQLRATDFAERYTGAIERVTLAVDRMEDRIPHS
jgi:predicted nucleotidyltransferase